MQMDQKIFSLSLTTETLSCYLLLTGLADQELPLHRKTVESLWSGSTPELDMALTTLQQKGIVALSGSREEPLRLLPAEMWRD